MHSSILGLVLGAVLCVIHLSPGVEGHGYLSEPYGRASAWRSVSNTDICLKVMKELLLGSQYQTYKHLNIKEKLLLRGQDQY